ncbi:ubiquitin-protein ligase e3 rbbp6 family involved in mrna cleavage, partial [Nannochloropsis oceanica]
MSSVLHYRFKTATETNSLRFEGHSLRVFDIKSAIVAEKRLDKGLDFDLELSNPQTKEVYLDETKSIDKNSTVLVKRVAAPRGSVGLLARLKANTPLTPQNMASGGWMPPQTIVLHGKAHQPATRQTPLSSSSSPSSETAGGGKEGGKEGGKSSTPTISSAPFIPNNKNKNNDNNNDHINMYRSSSSAIHAQGRNDEKKKH